METKQYSVSPTVKTIAILFYLTSILFIFGGILLTFSGGMSLPVLGNFGLIAGVVPGILAVGWGLVNFFAGRGLWRGASWGRALAIVVSGLYIILEIVGMVKGSGVNYLTLVINIAIVVALLMQKRAPIAV